MNSGEVVAQVSQDSRRDGRVPIDVQIDRLTAERSRLHIEKRRYESTLADLRAARMEAVSVLLKKRLAPKESLAERYKIEAEYRKATQEASNSLRVIEERLSDIKGRLANQNDKKIASFSGTSKKDSPEWQIPPGPVLVRIEGLLRLLVLNICGPDALSGTSKESGSVTEGAGL